MSKSSPVPDLILRILALFPKTMRYLMSTIYFGTIRFIIDNLLWEDATQMQLWLGYSISRNFPSAISKPIVFFPPHTPERDRCFRNHLPSLLARVLDGRSGTHLDNCWITQPDKLRKSNICYASWRKNRSGISRRILMPSL